MKRWEAAPFGEKLFAVMLGSDPETMVYCGPETAAVIVADRLNEAKEPFPPSVDVSELAPTLN